MYVIHRELKNTALNMKVTLNVPRRSYQWDICTPLDTIRNIQTISFIPDLVSLLKSLYRYICEFVLILRKEYWKVCT